MLRINAVILSLILFAHVHTYSIEGDVGIGYRQDRLNWNFDGGRAGPNILSELKWKHLEMVNYYGQLRAFIPIISYVRLTGNYGSIFSGKNYDYDYHGDDRTDQFAYAINKADRGEAFEISAAIGYPFRLIPYLTIVPLIGYAQQEQHLQLYDGVQVFYIGNYADNTPLPELASNYRAKWYSPFIGVDIFFARNNRWKIIATGEWHTGTYRGTGYWNLRTDLLSDIRHSANGYGAVLRLQGIYRVWNKVTVGLVGESITMHTRRGLNEVDILDHTFGTLGEYVGNHVVTAQGGLNGVHWQSWRIILTTGFDF